MKPTCEECRRRLKQISKYKDAIGYTFHTQTTFGEIANWNKVKKLLPNSNIVIFPKKYVA